MRSVRLRLLARRRDRPDNVISLIPAQRIDAIRELDELVSAQERFEVSVGIMLHRLYGSQVISAQVAQSFEDLRPLLGPGRA
jgi:hypothetical protein